MRKVWRQLRREGSDVGPTPSGAAGWSYYFHPLRRNLDDLRRLVQQLTGCGVRIEFLKEGLTFTGEDSPMAHLLLSVMGAFAEFERALIRERQREGIALAKQRGAYRGRKPALNRAQATELRRRAEAGEPKAALAREFRISRATLYEYLRASESPVASCLKPMTDPRST